MKVVLFAPPIMDDFFWGEAQPIAMDAIRECPPYGVYLLQAVLRRAGFDAIVADLIAAGTARVDQFAPEIDDCGLVGIAATSMSWPTAVKVIEQVRSLRPDVPIVLGGIHPTMFDHYIMNAFLTCHCKVPPRGIRVRPCKGRTYEACTVYGRTDYWRVEGA